MQSASRNRISGYCFKRVGERRSNTLQLGSHKAFLHLPTMIFLYFASLFPNCQRPSEYVFHLEHKTSVEHLLMALASSCCATCGTRLILSFQIAMRFLNGFRPEMEKSTPAVGLTRGESMSYSNSWAISGSLWFLWLRPSDRAIRLLGVAIFYGH